MDFPAYVPAAVREHISQYLEGEKTRSIPGYIDLLASAVGEVATFQNAISGYVAKWSSFDLANDPYLAGLRKRQAEAVRQQDMLAGDVECLRRLAHDARMQEAFGLLTREFTDDMQWRNFNHSAWAARVDFGKYRDRLKAAKELKREIADAAEALVNLIRQFSHTGVIGPDEFFSIPELLRQTDNHDMDDHNLHMWRSMRHYVLGDRRSFADKEEPDKESGGSIVGTVRVIFTPAEKVKLDPEEDARNTLCYAWGTAPDFSALLGTMANAARNFEPSESGMIGAAIQSRQRSPKTEYLRAFGNLLTDGHRFTLTTAIMQAMAIVANVVINLPDVDVTYDDVRKALANLGGGRLENSGGK
jgi:hypothetical protein